MRQPKRIGVELNPHIIGGTEFFLRALFSHLDRTQFTPVAISSVEGAWQPFLKGVAETHVVPYIALSGQPADVASSLRRLDLDLIQSSYFSPVLALAATQAAIPHVWRMGGHVDALEREWTAREKTHFLTIVRLTSQRVICGSRYLRSQFDGAGIDGVDVIHNGIDLTGIPLIDEPKDDGDLCVAMVAHLVPQKRHAVFLGAAARMAAELPRVRFRIFGASYDTPASRIYAESIQALATDLGLGVRLQIAELRDERFATLRHCDIIALPGVNEGASNAIVEAMALRIPVVAADSGGNAEIVADGATGVLVRPDDPEALARTLVGLLADRERRVAMGVAARARVEREFDIKICARRYEELYHDVIAGKAFHRRRSTAGNEG
jgi:glycosyltransferase involved in cell wall biosynthesis